MPRLTQDSRHRITITLDGVRRTGTAEPRTHLADFLRHELGAFGTHVGCEHGVCGACTVRLDGRAVRACLVLAVQADGCRVDTIEGLAARDAALGSLQAAFKRHHALQCGFCTPGVLMTLADYLGRHPDPSEAELRDVLSGHLCRCTGYTPIVAAALDAAATLRAAASKSERTPEAVG
jgi:2-furoyl-CoA dehydrogenase 2Fe-2S iron sulfur subunit